MDTGASKEERKRFIPDEHVQAMSGEKRRSHTTQEELVKNHLRSPGYVQVPYAGLQSSQRFTQEYDQGSDPGYYQSKKRKRTKVYHPLPISYTELLPILIQNYGISAIPARPRRPPYPKKHDISAKCEYHGGVRGHSTVNCMTFKDKVQLLINADPVKFERLVNGHQKH